MKCLQQTLKDIERRWLRPLLWRIRRLHPSRPNTSPESPGVEALFVALLRSEIRRREAGVHETHSVAIRYPAASGMSELEALAKSMLSLPSADRTAAG